MSDRASIILIALLGTLAAGCVTEADPSPGTLDECIRGWWVDGAPTSPCDGACSGGGGPTPECASSDCTEYSFFGYLEDGLYYENRLSYSSESGTISALRSATLGTYTVLEDSVRREPTGWEPRTTCDGAELRQALVPWFRASPGFSDALDGATSGGTVGTFVEVPASGPPRAAM